MAAKLLQINFKFNVSSEEYRGIADQLAAPFAEVEGLRWKIWIINEAESEAGGFYLFDGEASRKAFLEGPLAAQVSNHPALSELSVKPFDVMAGPTAAARGPV
jgi:hypothetical protein